MCYDCEFGKNHNLYSFSKLYSNPNNFYFTTNKYLNQNPNYKKSYYKNPYFPYDKPKMNFDQLTSQFRNLFYAPATIPPRPPSLNRTPRVPSRQITTPVIYTEAPPPPYDYGLEHRPPNPIASLLDEWNNPPEIIHHYFNCENRIRRVPEPMGMNPIKFYNMCEIMEEEMVKILKRRNQLSFNQDIHYYNIRDNFLL